MRALGLALGFLADARFGDPARAHPVAGFGRIALAFERRVYRDSRVVGLVYSAALVGSAVAVGCLAQRGPRWWRLLATTGATWAVLGGQSLAVEGQTIAAQLGDGDVSAARQQITHLVSRDPVALSADELARAATESLAENSSDAVVAPLLWGAVAGIPGLLGYRAINTLDAMVGYRNAKYRRFGWASARLDDVVNWVPARVSALLAALGAPLVGGRCSDALAAGFAKSKHPSPNGAVVEGAFAGALQVTLGGSNVYGGAIEDRGELGFGPAPTTATLPQAVTLLRFVSVAAGILATWLAWCLEMRRK